MRSCTGPSAASGLWISPSHRCGARGAYCRRSRAATPLLAVRDLASGYQLCWLPVTAAASAITCAALARLFAAHGMPLVLKADNGPPFRADQTKRFLQQAGVHFLFSPPHWPGYNGAIEAAIGSLKTRTERHAADHDHAGRWTWA